MAVQQWTIYNQAKLKMLTATINLASTTFKCALFQVTSNAATLTNSLYGDLTNEVANGNGYTTGGVDLTGEVCVIPAAAPTTVQFDCDNPTWTASGGTIPGVAIAVIYMGNATTSLRHLLCFSQLSDVGFTIASGDAMELQMNLAGVFTQE